MPAGNFCRISEAPWFGFPHTANICSPGCLGSTGFHGIASLVVKVPWVAPAFPPAAGVAPVPRCCANDCVVIVIASATTTLGNTLLFSRRALPAKLVDHPNIWRREICFRKKLDFILLSAFLKCHAPGSPLAIASRDRGPAALGVRGVHGRGTLRHPAWRRAAPSSAAGGCA